MVIRYRRNASTQISPIARKISSAPYVYSPIANSFGLISTNGLVVNLDAFNPTSYPGSGTTWTDLTGNANNVTLENSPIHNALQGFISFNGTNQRGVFSAATASLNSGTQSYTFEALFRMRTLPIAEYAANGHIWGGQIGNNMVLYVNPAVNGQSTLNMNHDDARYSPTGAFTIGTILPNTWVHWVVSWEATNSIYRYTHYLNGFIDRQGGQTVGGQEARTWGSGHVAFDARWNTYSELDVSVLRQYNRVLGYDEVLQNFDAVRGRFGL